MESPGPLNLVCRYLSVGIGIDGEEEEKRKDNNRRIWESTLLHESNWYSRKRRGGSLGGFVRALVCCARVALGGWMDGGGRGIRKRSSKKVDCGL